MNSFFQFIFKQKKQDKWLDEQRLLKHFYVPDDNGYCKNAIADTPNWLREFFAWEERERLKDEGKLK